MDVLLFETNPNRPPQPPSPPPLWRAANPGKPGGGAAAGERSWAGARVPEVSWHVAPPKVPVWLLWLVHWHSVRACISGPSSSSKPLDSVPSHARNSTGRCRIPSPSPPPAMPPTRPGRRTPGGRKCRQAMHGSPFDTRSVALTRAAGGLSTGSAWGCCVAPTCSPLADLSQLSVLCSMHVQGMAQCFVVYA